MECKYSTKCNTSHKTHPQFVFRKRSMEARKPALQLAFSFYILFQEHILSIENGIGKLVYPIAKDKHPRGMAEHQIKHDVPMAIHKEINLGMFLEVLFGVNNQGFFFLTLIIGFLSSLTLHSAMFGPFQTKVDCPSGMEGGKQTLQSGAMKHGTQELEFPILVSQAIAMGQIELFAVDFAIQGLPVNNHPTLLFQIITTPYIWFPIKKCTSTPLSVNSESFPKKRV